jgi:two-component system, NarL family, nitrate/nitrite response regulator NarL
VNRLRVLIVGDDPLARGGLAGLMVGQPGLVVAGQSSRAALGPDAGDADILLWDLGPGASESWRPSEADLERPVVCLTDDPRQAAGALAAGARGVLTRDVDAPRLSAALHATALGLVVVEEAFAGPLARPRPRAELAEPLTPREGEVLALLVEGLSNKQIASRLGISEHTAKFHVNAILGKLGAQSRSEAIVQGARLGLVVL